jgi:hypothetical protein
MTEVNLAHDFVISHSLAIRSSISSFQFSPTLNH